MVAAGAIAGCGQVDESGTGVRVLVTTDNGVGTVLDQAKIDIDDGESVLAVLQRVAKVTTDARGTVTSIDGKVARGKARWSFWVNGVELRGGALEIGKDVNVQQLPIVKTPRSAKLHNGDVVWFDLRPDADVGHPRGVVGTFPEPFVHGADGMRWPVRVECAEPRSAPCRTVRDTLVREGIPAVTNLLRTSYNPESARVSVGLWTAVREDPAAQLAERGPGASGVFAKPQPNGREIALLDAAGRPVRTLAAGTGLIFASRYREEPPSWAVTGTDEAGLLAAAEAWDVDVLARRLAVAVQNGTVTPLPVPKAGATRR